MKTADIPVHIPLPSKEYDGVTNIWFQFLGKDVRIGPFANLCSYYKDCYTSKTLKERRVWEWMEDINI